MEYPISVIIPASKEYQAKYKDECLASIPTGCEIIILDIDISKDRWVDLLNKGIKQSKNEWILPLGIDDKIYPGAIEKLISELDDSDVYFGKLVTFGNSSNELIPNKNPTKEDFKVNNQIYFTSLFRRSKALEIGGYYAPDNKPYYEDWDFWFRMILSRAKFKYIDYPIFLYRDHENQSYKKMQKDYEELKQKVLTHVKDCYPNSCI